jgi:hypothetical protein
MLKIAVIVMGIFLVGGFGLVMATIVYQASKLGETSAGASAPTAVAQGALGVPKDATVMSMALDGSRLALHLRSSAGSEIAVIDVRSGRVLSRIRLNADKP